MNHLHGHRKTLRTLLLSPSFLFHAAAPAFMHQPDVTTRHVSAILTECGLQLVASAESPPLRPLHSYEWVDTRFYKFVRSIEMPDAVRVEDDPDTEPHHHVPLGHSLLPKWNLPMLVLLELICAPDLQLYYDSLETMRCLEELTLVIRRRTDLKDQLQGIPQLTT
ncbi:hypothetical protein BGX24_003868 [Mortierella sp. AD032]|nr:hypothetical protein BGX24_003868 [Mortierella sp. AD032]